MKLKQLLILFFLTNLSVVSYSQFGIKESQHLNSIKESDEISLLIKGDLTDLKTHEESLQYTIKYTYNDLAAVRIKKENLSEFYRFFPKLIKEIPLGNGSLLMDTALIHNNVTPVHNGTLPLTQPYTGVNVVVGIIDAGIYFAHQDFKNIDGSSRIKFIWDQNVSSAINQPQPYNYGQEWSYIDIDNGTCNHVEPANQYGHGTTVAGAACGNGTATGTHKGVAPKSDIIAVAINYSNFLSNIVDAIDYIFKKADAMGKPCVINTSLGTYIGSHDGKDLPSLMIEALLDEKPGRAVVAAAGNGNNINQTNSNFNPTHLSYVLSADTNFTWFKPQSSIGKVYFSLWADTADFNGFNFALGNDDGTTFESRSKTDFFNKESFIGHLDTGVYIQTFALDSSVNLQGTIDMYLKQINGRYNLEIAISPTNSTDLWRFMCTGSGKFDIWSSENFHGSSNMVYTNLPPNFIVSDIDKYKSPDNKKCIVSSWQCSDKVITVGNYANRSYWYDVDSTYRSSGLTPGEIYYKSSEGPTRDQRLKPDIATTGNVVFATGNANFVNSALAVNRRKVALGAKHNYNGGTSMSSPLVAGAVALYLEKNPQAWWYEIKAALIESAKRDNFTGPTETTTYGNGKLDAFAMLNFEAVLGCTDTSMYNYNPLANVDNGSCIPFISGCTDSLAYNYNPLANTNDSSCIDAMYGCTDSTAFNFDSLANIDDGTCIPIILGCTDSTSFNFNPLANTNDGSCTYTSIHNVNPTHFFTIQPNPCTSFIDISLKQIKADECVFYSILGKEVLRIKLFQHKQKIDVKNLSSGLYLVNLMSNHSIVSSQRLIKK